MTESDAKTKWCPLAQISFQVYSGTGHSEMTTCVASACMMWQWGWYEGDRSGERIISTTDGFCGLGGQP